MAKFRYALQSILDLKKKLETQAKQEFLAARNVLDEEEKQLDVLFKRKRSYEENARGLLTGPLKVREIEEARNAVLCMEEYIALQRERVRQAQIALDQAKERLADVMKERKTQETLREKAFEDFLQEENRRESKAVDELVSYTYGRKRQVND